MGMDDICDNGLRRTSPRVNVQYNVCTPRFVHDIIELFTAIKCTFNNKSIPI